jgi:hypothetical protein
VQDALCCHEARVRSLINREKIESILRMQQSEFISHLARKSTLHDPRAASSRRRVRARGPSATPGICILVLGFAIFVTGANAQSKAPSAGTLGNPLQAQPLAGLSATRDRPLFSPDRRPPAPPPAPVAAAPPPPAPPPDVTLLGVVVDRERAHAIVRSGSAKIERVQIGDDIGGWKVSQIEGRRLLLALDGREAAFTLFSRASAPQPDDPALKVADRPQDQPQQYGTQQASPAAEAPRAVSRRRK